jgi:hypothetical protein
MKAGKGDSLRQEQGLFCTLFVAAWTKRMATGSTRTAGLGLFLKLIDYPQIMDHGVSVIQRLPTTQFFKYP